MEKQRYSDAELEEFRQVILKKIEDVEADLRSLKSMSGNRNGTDDTFKGANLYDKAQEVLALESNYHEINRLSRLLLQLHNGLTRIQFKTYGICCVTGNLIPKERLLAVPITTKSIEAKLVKK
jgi:DnaK suppressor protein